jgi:glycosyltransferase involved in cell wall biosynthesis
MIAVAIMNHFAAVADGAEVSLVGVDRAAAGQPCLSNLRIALFSGNYNCVRDGANRALNRLVEYLITNGAAVRVYSPTVATPAFEPAGDLVSIPSVAIPGRPEYRIATGLTAAARADIRGFRPTHFHLSAPDWLGTSAQAFAKALNVPVVISHHTQFEAYLRYYGLTLLAPWMRRRIRRFYQGADMVLAPNAPIARSFADILPPEKVAVWGRGVDPTMFTPGARDIQWRRQLGYADDEPVILFLGRIVVEKGLEVFARVIDEVRSRGHRVVPLVVGEGPALEWFKRRLGDVRATGHLEDVDLGRAVASADILVNPSETEAFGNVNLEAMASGLAIVSADVESAQALLHGEADALLVPAGDISAFADAVDRLIAAPEERARIAGAALLESRKYSWSDVLAQVAVAYETARNR